MKKIFGFALLSLILLSFGCGKEPVIEEEPPALVGLGRILRVTVDDQLTATGLVAAEQVSNVVSAVSGVVTAIPVREGDVVRRGQVLLEIEKAAYAAHYAAAQAQVTQALANLDQAKRDLERGENLFGRGYISQQELENYRVALSNAQSAYDNAAANRDFARVQLNDATVTAPFDGVVDARLIEVGEAAGPQAPLFTLVDLSELKVRVLCPQESAARMRLGLPAVVSVEALSREFPGLVSRIGAQLDAQTRSLPVEVLLTGERDGLRPGMFAKVTITLGERENVTVVPSVALVRRSGRDVVFTLNPDGQTVAQREILLGGEVPGAGIEIVSGLEDLDPETPLVVTGASGLSDGDAVAVITQEAEAADEAPEGQEVVSPEDLGL